MGKLKVSLFTPCHDKRFLKELYATIKGQDFYEWIIVFNNGVEPMKFDDPRVKCSYAYGTEAWVGPLKAIACSRASGDILFEMDHDDMLMPTAIADVQEAFEDSDVGFVYSNTVHLFQDKETGARGPVQRFDSMYGWEYREVEFQGLKLDEHISFKPTPNSISRIWFAPNHLRAFRRTVYEAIGGYDKTMRILDDLDLMCRLYKVTKFCHIDKGLYVYRVHGENTWLQHNREIQENVMRIHDKYIEDLAETWAKNSGLRIVELGGRMAAKAGYETVDLRDSDIIADLNDPWPFEDGSVGVVRAFDVFEHLTDSIHTMKELYRVLAPGGYAFIQVPSTDGRGAFQDPTHKTFWNQNSFLYYTTAQKNHYIDCPVRFQAMKLGTSPINEEGVCWVQAHLVKLGTERVPGEVKI